MTVSPAFNRVVQPERIVVKSLDLRPALDAAELRVRQMMAEFGEANVLLGEVHSHPLHIFFKQALMERFFNDASKTRAANDNVPFVFCKEEPHNILGAMLDNFHPLSAEEKADVSAADINGRHYLTASLGIARYYYAPSTNRNINAFCLHNNIPTRPVDAAKYRPANKFLDPRDRETLALLRPHLREHPFSDVEGRSPLGLKLRNTMMVDKILTQRQKLRFIDVGNSHLFGNQPARHWHDYSLSAQFTDASRPTFAVYMDVDGIGINNCPGDAAPMISQSLIVDTEFAQYDRKNKDPLDEVVFLAKAIAASGSTSIIYAEAYTDELNSDYCMALYDELPEIIAGLNRSRSAQLLSDSRRAMRTLNASVKDMAAATLML